MRIYALKWSPPRAMRRGWDRDHARYHSQMARVTAGGGGCAHDPGQGRSWGPSLNRGCGSTLREGERGPLHPCLLKKERQRPVIPKASELRGPVTRRGCGRRPCRSQAHAERRAAAWLRAEGARPGPLTLNSPSHVSKTASPRHTAARTQRQDSEKGRNT